MTRRIGKYTLLDTVGEGGMGVVHRAHDGELGRDVALKVLRPDQLHFERSRERFAREVGAAARLSHPGIAAVYDYGETDGVPWFAQELVAGASLDRVLASVPGRSPEALSGEDLRVALAAAMEREPSEARGGPEVFTGSWVEVCLRIVRRVADALQHAHERGVVHGDVKPSNVVLTPEGRVVLVDFGVARLAGEESLAHGGAFAGSLPYSAPEVVDGGVEAADARADVYSLGVTAYELLGLGAPYASPSAERLRGLILDGDAPPLAARNPSVPADAATVCHHAMARAPGRRYPTAAALASDLANVLARRPIVARPPGPLRRLVRWTQRRPGLAACLVVAFFALVVLPSGCAVQESVTGAELDSVRRRLNATLEQRRRDVSRLLDVVDRAGAALEDPRYDAFDGVAEVRASVAEQVLAVLEDVRRVQPDDRRLAAQAERFRRFRGE